jgi:hypothetical protein
MRHSYDEVRQFAEELPEDQRVLLANLLWESASGCDRETTDAEIAAAWDSEIARRVSEIKAGTAVTCSVSDLEKDLRSTVGP